MGNAELSFQAVGATGRSPVPAFQTRAAMKNCGKVKLEFWMADRLEWGQPGPVIIEEPLEDGESLRGLLSRLAARFSHFSEAVFDPQTQSLSSEVTILINEHVNLSQGMDTKLKSGDRVLFLPILGGG